MEFVGESTSLPAAKDPLPMLRCTRFGAERLAVPKITSRSPSPSRSPSDIPSVLFVVPVSTSLLAPKDPLPSPR